MILDFYGLYVLQENLQYLFRKVPNNIGINRVLTARKIFKIHANQVQPLSWFAL